MPAWRRRGVMLNLLALPLPRLAIGAEIYILVRDRWKTRRLRLP